MKKKRGTGRKHRSTFHGFQTARYSLIVTGILLFSLCIFFSTSLQLRHTWLLGTQFKILNGFGQKVEEDFTTEEKETFTFPLLDLLKNDIWDRPPANSAMPPRAEFSLRKEIVEHRAEKNVVVVTFSNFAFLDFVTNWVRHLTNVGVFNIIVGAMDTNILEALFRIGIPVFDLESDLSTEDVGWDSHEFHKMGREKVIIMNAFLVLGYEVLICDTDMVWLQNPLPYFQRWPQADLFTSSDDLFGYSKGDELEPWHKAVGDYNIGILYARNTPAVIKFAAAWAYDLGQNSSLWDQDSFNDLLRYNIGPLLGDALLANAFNGELKLAILPVCSFCSGHTYFIQNLPKKKSLRPYSIHTTFQFAGTPGKRHRLREACHFFDSPEYYDPPGGLVTFKQTIPRHILFPDVFSLESHFQLINHQLKSIRNLFALATILNRTAVMPTLWCHFDRMWYSHPGVLHGTMTSQPFICPMDHVFEIGKMVEPWPENEFGPSIHFREYSFFHNPRFPQADNITLVVNKCNKSTACNKSHLPKRLSPTIFLPSTGLNEIEIIQHLSSFKDMKVVEFTSIDDAFSGWKQKDIGERFYTRISQYLGAWCCGYFKTKTKYIKYNFFTDEDPDWRPYPEDNLDGDDEAYYESN